MTLRERIEQEIRDRGPIPFSRYMELCLYDPDAGYYARSKEQFGKAGDFYTSSDVHAIFGRLMARQFEEMWRVLGAPKRIALVELGPGRGLFARDVLDWSREKFPHFFGALHYALVERSAGLREKLAFALGEYIAAGKASVEGDVASRVSTDNVIVFANEFFDALPVEVLSNQGVMRVGWEAGRFVESFVSASAAETKYLDRFSIHPDEGERVEAGLEAQRWMERIAAVPRGFVVIIDYGYTREELLAGRHRSTIMCCRQHSASDNPYEAPGEQDITAHVNFSALRAADEEVGLDCLGLVTQAQFLIGIGEETQFSDAFEDARLPQERAKRALQLKHLVTPAGMGETFAVLVMSKGVAKEKAAAVSGLKFAR
jgi:SAM-dependent MidA family methyltransferase